IKKWTVTALALALVTSLAGGLTFLANIQGSTLAGEVIVHLDEANRNQPKPDQDGANEERLKAVDLDEAAGKQPNQPPGKAPRTDFFGDPLPAGALARLGTLRFRHGYNVSFMAYSSDGKTIVFGGSGNVDNAIRMADARTGKELRTFELKQSEMPGRLALS